MKRFIRRYFFILLLFFAVAAIFFGYYFKQSISYKSSNNVLNGEAKILIEKVDNLAVVPQDEVPTIAKVSNPEFLKNQPFFQDAKIGDIVFIYSNARKAILYDPKLDKIKNISNINVGNLENSSSTLIDIKDKSKQTTTSGTNQF